MTNKNQVGETVWFYSYSHGKVMDAEIVRIGGAKFWETETVIRISWIPLQISISPHDLYDTEAEAVEATRAWAENRIKNLQTILDNLNKHEKQ